MFKYFKDHFPYFSSHILSLSAEISALEERIERNKFISDSEKALLKNKLQEKEKENEFLLVQLYQIQNELDKPSDAELSAKNEVILLRKTIADLQTKQLDDANELAKNKREISVLQKTITELRNTLQIVQAEQEQQKIELKDALTSLENQETNLKNLADLELEYSRMKVNLEERLDEGKASQKLQIQNIKGENERLMLSLHRAQEELERIYIDSQKNKEELDGYIKRWRRLEVRVPAYFDVGAIRVIMKQESSQERVEFQFSEYYKGAVEIRLMTFQMQDKDGHLGINLSHNPADPFFYPSLVSSNQSELSRYVKLTQEAARNLEAAMNVIEFAIATKWRGIDTDKTFDPAFWNTSLANMLAEYRKLPSLFRYDYAKLKMEVNNSDYENIWLELHGVSFGARFLKKIEVRISGAMIKSGELSRYPKIEIPLIDGIEKPFSTWFPESSDIYGQKLEFRFDLDRKAMDTQVWSRLSAPDVSFCLGLIGVLPRVIEELKNDKIMIARSWDDWAMLLMRSIQIINASRKPKEPTKSNEYMNANESQSINEARLINNMSEVKSKKTDQDLAVKVRPKALSNASKRTKKITITRTSLKK